jgi:hypothetical protein
MSFSKTVSVFAALASIFAAGAAGWKLSQDSTPQDTSVFENKIVELEKKLEEAQQPQVPPTELTLPPPVAPVVQQAPPVATLPPPPPPVTTTETTP